jgi:ureidoacrylate peracid hydrolase
MQAGPPELQAATVYDVERFFGWITNTTDFCALTNR